MRVADKLVTFYSPLKWWQFSSHYGVFSKWPLQLPSKDQRALRPPHSFKHILLKKDTCAVAT